MSVLRCDECERFIDTDFDVEAYDEAEDMWFCESCRDTRAALALANEETET